MSLSLRKIINTFIKEKNINKKVIGLVVASQLALGCSTMNQTVLTSAGVGATAGAVVSHNTGSGSSMKKTAVGALTGAVISGVIGYFIHKRIEKRDAKVRRDTLFNLDKHDVSMPQGFNFSSAHGLTTPKIESEWVPTRVEGKRLIEGHKIWLITDEARWIPSQELKKKNKK